MHKPVIQNSVFYHQRRALEHSFLIPKKLESQLKDYPKQFQPPGELNAWRYLNLLPTNAGLIIRNTSLNLQKVGCLAVAYLLTLLGVI